MNRLLCLISLAMLLCGIAAQGSAGAPFVAPYSAIQAPAVSTDTTIGSTNLYATEADTTVIIQNSPGVILEPNFPNPFRTTTTIAFSLNAETKRVTLKVYDSFYDRSFVLIDRDVLTPGRYEVEFAPEGRVSSGVFFFVLTTESYREVRRMVYIR